MKKQPDITEATRARIVNAFCTIAKEKPMEKVTVKEIAALAGYNRTTFYRYFADAFAIQEYIEEEVINELLETVKSKLAESNFDDAFFQAFLDMYHVHKEQLPVLLNDRNRSHFIKRIKQSIISVSDQGLFHSGNEGKKQIVMDIYYSGVFSAVAEWLQNPDIISVEELLDIIRDLFSSWYWPELNESQKRRQAPDEQTLT